MNAVVKTKTKHKTEERKTVEHLIPNLVVADVEKTIAFYRDVLGFTVGFKMPETGVPHWAFISNGGVSIMLYERNDARADIPELAKYETGGAVTFYITVPDLQTLYNQIKGKVTLAKEFGTTHYGCKEFAIVDCNGFVLVFSQSPEQQEGSSSCCGSCA